MKNILYVAVVALGLGAVSCSSDDNEAYVEPVFPDNVATYDIRPDEVDELTFDANLNWVLTSDKQWMKFRDGEGNSVQHLQGKAGEKLAVEFTVTDGAQDFVEDVATVLLRMGGKEQPIAKVTRAAKERIVIMYKAAGKEFEEITELIDEEFDSQKMALIGFSANFDWKIDMTSLPSWITEDENRTFRIKNLSGEAGQAVDINRVAAIDVALEERYTDREGYITVRDMNSDYTHQFRIYAPAIEEGKIQWIGNVTELKRGFLWDDKGNQLKKSLASNEVTWLDTPVVCHVVIRNNDFTPHFVEWDAATKTAIELSPEESWVKVVKQEKGLLTLAAENNPVRGNYRKMIMFLLPKGVDVDDFTSCFTETGGYLFDASSYGISLEQYGLLGGFALGERIQNGYRYEFSMIEEAKEIADKTEIVEKLNLVQPNNIYEYTVSKEDWDSGKDLGIAPLSLIENWSQYKLYNSRFECMDSKPVGWSTASSWSRMGAYSDNVYTYFLRLSNRLPYDDIADDCLYIVFYNGINDKDLGTIVIRKK